MRATQTLSRRAVPRTLKAIAGSVSLCYGRLCDSSDPAASRIHAGRNFVHATRSPSVQSGVNAVGATWGRPVGARVETVNAT
jgi:hypothetical protein